METLEVAYTGGSKVFPSHTPDTFQEGDARLKGRTPMEVILDIGKSGSLHGRPLVYAYVLSIVTRGPGQQRVAAVWGRIPMYIKPRISTETVDLGGRSEN